MDGDLAGMTIGWIRASHASGCLFGNRKGIGVAANVWWEWSAW
jgi:hypothetical protein